MTLPPELKNAAADPVELTVAGLLELFGERNRDPEIVGRIESTLTENGLCSEPTLLHGHLNSPIVVRGVGTTPEEPPDDSGEETVVPAALHIGDLPTARLPEGALVSLNPDDDIMTAHMVMMEGNFSQLPVMSGPYMLDGVVSWQSIAMAHARGRCETLADATAPAPEVSIRAELLVAIPDIIQQGCLFVRDTDQKISGLVTASDLSQAFGELTGPFLQLGEIERRLRRCVERMCPTVEELQKASNFKKATSPEDLMLGQVLMVFKKTDRWERLKWALPQQDFVKKLEALKNIRNQVAHFRPNPLTPEERTQIEVFASLVKYLVP
ncbi:hypothetical protein ACQPZ8_16290 [Actinomadura nitritigenes]|uniref:hypothetical protein n=1 Tax=Actinomadura nitritigenes TaxID=134602 RepID=UPI003D94A241